MYTLDSNSASELGKYPEACLSETCACVAFRK